MTIEDEIKNAINVGKVKYGFRQTRRSIVKGSAKKVIYANNCPDNIKADLKSFCKAAKIDIEEYPDTQKQLGIICGKPFKISTLALLK